MTLRFHSTLALYFGTIRIKTKHWWHMSPFTRPLKLQSFDDTDCSETRAHRAVLTHLMIVEPSRPVNLTNGTGWRSSEPDIAVCLTSGALHSLGITTQVEQSDHDFLIRPSIVRNLNNLETLSCTNLSNSSAVNLLLLVDHPFYSHAGAKQSCVDSSSGYNVQFIPLWYMNPFSSFRFGADIFCRRKRNSLFHCLSSSASGPGTSSSSPMGNHF